MGEEQTPTNTMHNNSQGHGTRKLLKRLIMIIIALAVVGVGGFLWWQTRDTGRVVFTIDGQKYREDEVNELISYPTTKEKMKREDAAKQAFEDLKVIHTAKKLGFEPSEVEINAQKNRLFADSDTKKTKWADMSAAKASIEDRMQYIDKGLIGGYLYIFRFGERVERGYDYTPEGYGNEQLIKQDRDYAYKKAKEYHRALEEKTMTPKEVYDAVKKDPKLGYYNKPNTNQSSRFTETGTIGSDGTLSGFGTGVDGYVTLNTLQQGVNKIQTGKSLADAMTSEQQGGEGEGYKDTYFYFAYVDQYNKNLTRSDFDKAIKDILATYTGYEA